MNMEEEFKRLKDQVYANHRLIKQLQKDNHAQAVKLNRITKLLKDNKK